MNVLVVMPQEIYVGEFNYNFPLGPAYISAVLKQAGHDVTCLNMYHRKGNEHQELTAIARSKRIDVVALGAMSPAYPNIRKIIGIARKVFPSAIIVLGGQLVTATPEATMIGLAPDYGVVGEGETTMVELLAALESGAEPREVPGLAILDSATGKVFLTPMRHSEENLDDLPMPDYEGFEFDRALDMMAPVPSYFGSTYFDEPRMAYVLGSRSCPFKCSFCYHPAGRKYAQRSLPSLLEEIDYLIGKYRINYIYMLDDLFVTPSNMERVYEFCDAMKERGMKWFCQIMLQSVTRELLQKMKDCGCIMIGAGIENVSAKILRSMRKPVTLEQINSVLAMAWDVELDVFANLLFGDPEETWDTFFETYQWWLANRKYGLGLSLLYYLPDSEIYRRAKQKGVIKDDLTYLREYASKGIGACMINGTDMPDAEFTQMAKLVEECKNVSSYNCGPISEIRLLRVDEYDRERYFVRTRCPHCAGENEYGGLAMSYHSGRAANDLGPAFVWLKCRQCTRTYSIRNFVASHRFSEVAEMGDRLTTAPYLFAKLADQLFSPMRKTSRLFAAKNVRIAKWKRKIVNFVLNLPQKSR